MTFKEEFHTYNAPAVFNHHFTSMKLEGYRIGDISWNLDGTLSVKYEKRVRRFSY